VLLGGGHQAEVLEHLTQELGVASRVHFHPKVALEAVSGLTASADVGVQVIRNTCFNHWSTDSNKLFEYALAGLPVVASNFPEIRRVVECHGFGLLVNPESVAHIRAALERLRDEPELRCRLRARARASAVVLSWGSQEPKLLSLYERLEASR
jgi:glycosyltransferase involved in cell wall biosynthesis